VLVDCRACVHIWKSRQNKGNALMGEWLFLIALRHSTKLTSAAHVTATWRYGFAVSKFISKSLCCRKVLFCDVVRAHIRPRSQWSAGRSLGGSAAGHIRAIKDSEGVSPVGARQDQPHNESCTRCWVRKHLRTSAVPCSVPGRKILYCRVMLRHRTAWQRDGRVPRGVLWQF
jgi:hypothetical protein